MMLVLTITQDHLEAALDTTGPHLVNQKNDASLAKRGPRLVIADYHELLSGVATLVKKMKRGQTLTGILAIIGSISFTRHRQTIALVNGLGATQGIPVASLEYLEHAPDKKHTAKALAKLQTATLFKPLVPTYRAAPTITLRQAPLHMVEAHREQGVAQKP